MDRQATRNHKEAPASSTTRDIHLIADLWECPAERLADETHIRQTMVEAAQRAGATVVDMTFHRFEGGGVTGVVAVKESHLTIHTWPERGYAAVDIFLCGRTRPRTALRHLARKLDAKRRTVREHERGGETPSDDTRPRPGQKRMPSAAMLFLYGVTLIVAMCSLVYELLLAQTLSALLGNTLLRYSITIGAYLGALGVGAMLCGSRPKRAPERLIRVELALSALGGVAVPLFYFLDVLQRHYYLVVDIGSIWETIVPLLYLIATHAVIVGIGLLSGFEVPLLIALGERFQPGSTNKVLGVDYFGALVGSVLFPLVFVRYFGLLSTGFAVALANAVAAVLLIAWFRERRLPTSAAGLAIAAALVVALSSSYNVEQYFLKKFYYGDDMTGLASLFDAQEDRPDIERHRSAYQTIDIVRDQLDTQWVYDQLTNRANTRPGYPRDLWLYLNRDYQLHSGSDEFYHEWFVHAPVQANGRPLQRVLILGGGDGLALREVLKHNTVERVVHVDLDPVMLHLASHHPLLSEMNGVPSRDPRVATIQADAFSWLRTSRERFDAIYIDMPAVRDYNLSLVYSREFYGLVRHHLDPDGFLALDTPGGWCEMPYNLWDRYYSTLRAAGFETVVPMVARVNLDAPSVVAKTSQLAQATPLAIPVIGDATIELTEAQREVYFRAAFASSLRNGEDEFTLALPSRKPINQTWREDLAVPLDAFGPAHLPFAFSSACSTDFEPSKVNSIARPTLPEMELLSVRLH